MNVEKIPIRKVSESVVEQIEKLIEEGTFLPGEKLPSVRELCEMFGVGRSAVRDAIITLKGKGSVDVKQGEGTFIRKFDSTKLFTNQLILPDLKDIRQLFQVRKILEPGIAETAALNRNEKDLEAMENALFNENSQGWESDYNFHMAIANATGNEIITQLMQFISTTTKKAMNDFHQYIQENQSIVMNIDAQHQSIYQAIKNSGHGLAKKAMIEHLDYVENILQSSILNEIAKEQ